MSPSLFNVFWEFVMKELTGLDKGQYLVDNMSVDIRHADDTIHMSVDFNRPQETTTELEKVCSK